MFNLHCKKQLFLEVVTITDLSLPHRSPQNLIYLHVQTSLLMISSPNITLQYNFATMDKPKSSAFHEEQQRLAQQRTLEALQRYTLAQMGHNEFQLPEENEQQISDTELQEEYFEAEDAFDLRNYRLLAFMADLSAKKTQHPKPVYLTENIAFTDLSRTILFLEHFYTAEFLNEQVMKSGGTFRLRNDGDEQIFIQMAILSGKVKLQIKLIQVTSIIAFGAEKTLCVCFNFPAQLHIDANEKPVRSANYHEWERYINIMPANIPLLVKHMAMRGSAYFLKIGGNFAGQLAKLRIGLGARSSLLNEYAVEMVEISPYKQLVKAYSDEEFTVLFSLYNELDHKKSFNIQYSLISLLFSSHMLNASDIMELSREISFRFDPNDLQLIETTVLEMNAQSIAGHLQRKQSLIQIFKAKLEKRKPKSQLNEDLMRVPKLKMTPSGLIPCGWSIDMRNRLNRHFRDFDYQFIKVEVSNDDEDNQPLFNCREHMRSFLKQKLGVINFMDRSYQPLGWTQSQLKSASLWYTLEEHSSKFIPRIELLRFLGDFSKLTSNPALRAARIGQNLTTSYSLKLSEVTTEVIGDERVGKYMFTDGIGCISADLVRQIQIKYSTKATVFQVRYQGAKGVLALNRELPSKHIRLRESMVKFGCPVKESKDYLDIIEENYYKPGYLNKQIITLLVANGIKAHTFLEIQREYAIDMIGLSSVHIEDESSKSFKTECFSNSLQIESLGEFVSRTRASKQIKITEEPTLRGLLVEKYIDMFKRLIKKSHIKIEKSARILGIIDEFFILQEDEVYCTILKPQERFNVSGRVMLTRNPCMHPADIRVVRCISEAEATDRFRNYGFNNNYFQELTNCVIFPKMGSIPLTAQISGSDLDGDTFFITWDERLIPSKHRDPYIVDDVKPKERVWGGSDYPQMIQFFTEFIFNNTLGRLANSHLAKADQFGADFHECLALSKVYNKAVDYPKKGYLFEFEKRFHIRAYPHFMQKGQKKKSYKSTSALGQLFDQAKSFFNQFTKRNSQTQFKLQGQAEFFDYSYSDKEIKNAFTTMDQFQKQMKGLMKSYGFERQFLIYALRPSDRNKESRDQTVLINRTRLKYFHRFFENLGIPDPQIYYLAASFEDGTVVEPAVRKKLLLWYFISYFNWLKLSNYNPKHMAWRTRILDITGGLIQKLEVIGITWFCLPAITFQVVKSQ